MKKTYLVNLNAENENLKSNYWWKCRRTAAKKTKKSSNLRLGQITLHHRSSFFIKTKFGDWKFGMHEHIDLIEL